MNEPEEQPEPAGSSSEIILYQTEDRQTQIDVRLEGETVWLNQRQMAELFGKDVRTINEHIRNVFEEKELDEESVIRKFRITASDRKTYEVLHYSLDVIISVGYRVKSHRGTQFRIWATGRLREFLVKGFTLDDQRMLEGGERNRYFEELLERVRAIRASERMFWQKVTDIYATSVDYDVNAPVTREFFATIQNKFHFAIHGHTAAEVVVERASAEKQNMGLTTWKNAPGGPIRKTDVSIAKNYLNETEMRQLNLIVDQYLSFAELQAQQVQEGGEISMPDMASPAGMKPSFGRRPLREIPSNPIEASTAISHRPASWSNGHQLLHNGKHQWWEELYAC
jgi:hypothetical protein